jgi:hypothetical protein
MTICATCINWKSNYMTKYGLAGCKKLPIWTSTPPNGTCPKWTVNPDAEKVVKFMKDGGWM